MDSVSPWLRSRLQPTASLFLALVAILILSPLASPADQAPPAPSFFLPKSPIAAAYVLGRLSNKELIQAPRSEYVYVALLQRKGLERKYRFEALDGLASLRHSDRLTELLAALVELDRKGDQSEDVLRDLGSILAQVEPGPLAAQSAALERLASTAQLPLTRQIANAARITAGTALDPVWQAATGDPDRLADVVLSISFVRAAPLRAAFYSKLAPLLEPTTAPALRRAAIAAVVAVPGRETEAFSKLAGFLRDGLERDQSIASLEQLPRQSWPRDQLTPLAEHLLAYLRTVPAANRTDSNYLNALKFAHDLATLLPADQAKPLNQALEQVGVRVVVIRALFEQMLFDQSVIAVQPGELVAIILENEDAMPHNLAIVAAGALEEIGMAAESMGPGPDDQGRLYVPNSPKLLYATKMADPGKQAKLTFTAPADPGEYPYLCTFPGHWRRMVGTLAVVKDPAAYLASHAATQTKLTEWKLADLVADLPALDHGRDPMAGQALFHKLACVQCHKIGQDGNLYGPDLTEVFQRWKGDPAQVLAQILEPSKVIEDRYRNFEFELKDDDPVQGLIIKEDADTITIQTGPATNLIQSLKKAEVKSRRPQTSSVMPLGLLNSLSKDQILDLIAFLKAGGQMPAHDHGQH